MTSVTWCCVPNCYGSYKNILLHKFPNPEKDSERFQTWIYKIGGSLLVLEHDYIFKFRKVCHRHFETKYCLTKKLTMTAVPSLYLPDNGSKEMSSERLPSAEKETKVESVLPEKDDYRLWLIKDESVDIPEDGPNLFDDVPGKLSDHYNDRINVADNIESVTIEGNFDKKKHEGFQCVNCNGNFTRDRYTCIQCTDLDLCVWCESSGVHAHHYILRVPVLRPYNEIEAVLAKIRKCLNILCLDPISTTDFNTDDAISVESNIKSERTDQEEAAEEDNTHDENITKHESTHSQQVNFLDGTEEETQNTSPISVATVNDKEYNEPRMNIFKMEDTANRSCRIMTTENNCKLLPLSNDNPERKDLVKMYKLVHLKQYNRTYKKKSKLPIVLTTKEITKNSIPIVNSLKRKIRINLLDNAKGRNKAVSIPSGLCLRRTSETIDTDEEN